MLGVRSLTLVLICQGISYSQVGLGLEGKAMQGVQGCTLDSYHSTTVALAIVTIWLQSNGLQYERGGRSSCVVVFCGGDDRHRQSHLIMQDQARKNGGSSILDIEATSAYRR